jgi:plastocyanin
MQKLAVTLAATLTCALALAACGGGGGGGSSSPATTSGGGGGGGGGASSAAAGGGGGGSTVKISADPSGQLAYQQTNVSAKAGNVTVDFTNQAPLGHDVCVQDSSGKELGCTSVITGSSTSKAFSNLKAGNYTFFCSVDGHEAAGMKGTLKVQ